MATTIYYNAYGDEDALYRCKMTLDADYDLSEDTWHDSIAEQCAEDWHSNFDGWEASWPRVFLLFADKHSPPFAKFKIEREYDPVFYATAV